MKNVQDKTPGIAGSKRAKARISKNDPFIAAMLLFIIVTAVTLALAGANELTKDTIAAQEKIDRANAQIEVFPEAVSFEDLTAEFITSDETPEVKSLSTKRLTWRQNTPDRACDRIDFQRDTAEISRSCPASLSTARSSEIKVLSDDETPGLGKKVNDRFPFTASSPAGHPGNVFRFSRGRPAAIRSMPSRARRFLPPPMVDAVNSALAFC